MSNITIIRGNVGADLVLHSTTSGEDVVNFSIAHDTTRRNGDKVIKKTSWLDVTAWNTLARHLVRNLGKGSDVIVTGRLNERRYHDAQGNQRRTVEIIAEKVEFITLRPPAPVAEAQTPALTTRSQELIQEA